MLLSINQKKITHQFTQYYITTIINLLNLIFK